MIKITKLILHCDNQSCIKLACNLEMSDNIRCVSFEHHFLQDLIEEKKLDLKYASTTLMSAEQRISLLSKYCSNNVELSFTGQ